MVIKKPYLPLNLAHWWIGGINTFSDTPINIIFILDCGQVTGWKAHSLLDRVGEQGLSILIFGPSENYTYGADSQMEETGLWQKKYIAITAYDDGKFIPSYAILADAAPAELQLAHTQDLVLIRFADVLLMHAELSENANNLNRVRARAGLPAVSYSLQAIKNERRWELAFEGLRYFDLMRWQDAADALASQEGVAIKNKGIDTRMKAFGGGYRTRFEATGGFWPIPQSQIDLSEGILEQNPGWGDAAHEYPGW